MRICAKPDSTKSADAPQDDRVVRQEDDGAGEEIDGGDNGQPRRLAGEHRRALWLAVGATASGCPFRHRLAATSPSSPASR